MFVKELSIRIRREHENRFHIATTIILCILIAFIVIILAMFINNNVRKFLVSSEDNYYFPYSSYESSASYNTPCNFSSASSSLNSVPSTSYNRLEDWISPKNLSHSMSDEELMWRASMVPHVAEPPYNVTPKLAFMFLTRGALPLGPLWETFFKGHQGLFNIYLHTSPDFTFEPPQSSVFYKRKIPSKHVQWGKETMIEAERRLLANALLDFSNQRFILLSETCIPIFNFTFIYNYLISSNQSFLSSFDDPRKVGRGRYNKRMHPSVTLSDWRKGSQWFEVNRKLAINMISDTKYYNIFRVHCQPPCYMDEHYFPTLVNKVCPDLTSNRTITWTDWSRAGSHPTMFVRNQISEELLNWIRYGSKCSYNGEMSSVCFLFARKFHPNTLQPLLALAPSLLGFNTR